VVKLANPWLTMLLYAVAVPAVAYLVIVQAFHLSAAGRTALATVVSLGGITLAAWRYWSVRSDH
jgi:hypothetical protein